MKLNSSKYISLSRLLCCGWNFCVLGLSWPIWLMNNFADCLAFKKLFGILGVIKFKELNSF